MRKEGVCSECGSDELWAWYTQPERQTIQVLIEEDGKVTYDYTGSISSNCDANEDDEFFCAGCSRFTETVEQMVGLPDLPVPPGPDAWVRERARRGLQATDVADVAIIREVFEALAEYRTDDPLIAKIVADTPEEFDDSRIRESPPFDPLVALSLARTALDDPDALPPPHPAGMLYDVPFAIERIDEVMAALDGELRPAEALATIGRLINEVKEGLDNEDGITALLDSSLDKIDVVVAGLRESADIGDV